MWLSATGQTRTRRPAVVVSWGVLDQFAREVSDKTSTIFELGTMLENNHRTESNVLDWSKLQRSTYVAKAIWWWVVRSTTVFKSSEHWTQPSKCTEGGIGQERISLLRARDIHKPLDDPGNDAGRASVVRSVSHSSAKNECGLLGIVQHQGVLSKSKQS